MNLEVLVKEIESFTDLNIVINSNSTDYGLKIKRGAFTTSTKFQVGRIIFASFDGYEWGVSSAAIFTNNDEFINKFVHTDFLEKVKDHIRNFTASTTFV